MQVKTSARRELPRREFLGGTTVSRQLVVTSNLLERPIEILGVESPLTGTHIVAIPSITFGNEFWIEARLLVNATAAADAGQYVPISVDYYSGDLGVHLVGVEVVGFPDARVVGRSCHI